MKIILIIATIFTLTACTTQEDIDRCVENSNYSAETCAWILK